MTYKLGSLFDGSGGFPLAGSLCDVEPVWAAEVEPYPIAVTRSRFPNMKHLGDISKVNGAEIEPVDIITFGSPCQDLSVAGKRAGLKHEDNGDEETTRSGLFMEAVRIIKEMRGATNGRYPTFALWENVPGAYSSNKGEDFRVVLEELIKIVEPTAKMPACDKNGWPYADCYMGTGWSLAYRTFDAQYWGVPQRRRRIHLVLDLRGERAHKVLFEREGVRGYFAQGRTPWQGAAEDAEDCSGTADREGVGLDIYNLAVTGDTAASLTTATGQGASNTGPSILEAYTLKIRSGCEGGGKGALVQTDKSATLSTLNDQYLFQPVSEMVLESAGFCPEQSAKTRGIGYEEENSPTLRAGVVPGVAIAIDQQGGKGGANYAVDVMPTLCSDSHGTPHAVAFSIENHPADSRVDIDESGKVQTLTSRMGTGGGNVPMVMEQKPVYCLQGNGIDRADTAGCNGKGWTEDKCYTLNTIDRPAVAYPVEHKTECLDVGFINSIEECDPTLLARTYKDPHLVAYPGDAIRYIVRRLTPTECARLQGFADRWGDIDHKEDFTDEEYRFWLDVRNTHATVIGGKEAKDYTKQQMLTWYNNLHTDSAEYKMWGNGIALPPALYCMQGMVDALNTEADSTPDPAADVQPVEEKKKKIALVKRKH